MALKVAAQRPARAPRGRPQPSRCTWWRWWSPAARWTSASPQSLKTREAAQAELWQLQRSRLRPRLARPTSLSTPNSPRPMLRRRRRQRQRSAWSRLRQTALRLRSGRPRTRPRGRCCSSRACAARSTAWAMRCARDERRGANTTPHRRRQQVPQLCLTQRRRGCAPPPRWARTARCASRLRVRRETQRDTCCCVVFGTRRVVLLT